MEERRKARVSARVTAKGDHADKMETPTRTDRKRRKSQDLKAQLENAEAGRPVEGAATDTAAVDTITSALSQLLQWLFCLVEPMW